MPKVGMEAVRRRELIAAAIDAIHARGSLDITIRDIAARAGVSQGLAHHYFGSKDRLIVAAMRHLLSQFSEQIRIGLQPARTPRERISAVIRVSLGEKQFRPEVVSAWLVFYVHAQESAKARQLLSVYTRRLRSNLMYGLKPLTGDRAALVAEGIASLIDGIYIRHALGGDSQRFRDGHRLVEDYVDLQLGFSQGTVAKSS
ncbi:MAG: transcriptional regulator BetI [Rhizobiaceae bacterium]